MFYIFTYNFSRIYFWSLFRRKDIRHPMFCPSMLVPPVTAGPAGFVDPTVIEDGGLWPVEEQRWGTDTVSEIQSTI
jgi:hypothetical protein